MKSLVAVLGAPCSLVFLALFLASTCLTSPGAPPTTAPAIDPALWAKMTDIDARAARIGTLTAEFEQKKFTALMRKPLISSGTVRVKGSLMRWDTERPEKTVMLVTDKNFQLYYPAQNTVEIYSIDQRLAELAASPLPRLAVLRDRFSFAQIPVADMDRQADPARYLALKLTPIQEELRQHVQEVCVLLDTTAGYIVQAEFTDADGDRTVLVFRKVQINVEVGELELKLPPGTKTTRPLEGLPAAPPSRAK